MTHPNKYQRIINGAPADVYDVLDAFQVTCPATQHAIKKLLMPGQRGTKDTLDDLCEAMQSINRAVEMECKRREEARKAATQAQVGSDVYRSSPAQTLHSGGPLSGSFGTYTPPGAEE